MTTTKQIKIQYFASLREQADTNDEEINTKATTAKDLYQELMCKYSFTLPENNVGVAINGRLRPLDSALACGDTVVYIPPVAGG